MPEIMKPTNKDTVSSRRINSTKEDRAKQLKEFKEDKAHKEKLKEDRYARLKERQKGKPSGKGTGRINIEVTGNPS
jgi:hypothetical protein